jgi:hypothetical protein
LDVYAPELSLSKFFKSKLFVILSLPKDKNLNLAPDFLKYKNEILFNPKDFYSTELAEA